MSVKSDNWIRAQCQTPTHILKHALGGIEYASEPFTRLQLEVLNSNKLMSELTIPYDSIGNTYSRLTRITEEELKNWKPIITPFASENVREENGRRILSYGVSSYGYDVRLSRHFKIFSNINNAIIDPLNFSNDCCVDFEGDVCIVPPNSYVLGYTLEYFNIPKDVLVIAVGKSTYARVGAIVNVTPIEPGFKGQVVIEISNATNLPLKIYANQGIAQFLFFQSDEPCSTSYADKNGKYQGQTGLTTAKV